MIESVSERARDVAPETSRWRRELFRVRGFEAVEKICVINKILRDLVVIDGQLYGVAFSGIRRLAADGFSPPMPTGIKGTRTLAGRSATDLVAVGDGIARFDGAAWRTLESDVEDLRCVATHGDTYFAAGREGVVARVVGDRVESKTVEGLGEVTAIAVDDAGNLSLVGNGKYASARFEDLSAQPFAPGNPSGVQHFRGERYWGAVGDGDAMGLFVDRGQLVRIGPHMSFHLLAVDRYLYGSGERRMFRYDGERFELLQLAYDDAAKAWNLARAAI